MSGLKLLHTIDPTATLAVHTFPTDKSVALPSISTYGNTFKVNHQYIDLFLDGRFGSTKVTNLKIPTRHISGQACWISDPEDKANQYYLDKRSELLAHIESGEPQVIYAHLVHRDSTGKILGRHQVSTVIQKIGDEYFFGFGNRGDGLQRDVDGKILNSGVRLYKFKTPPTEETLANIMDPEGSLWRDIHLHNGHPDRHFTRILNLEDSLCLKLRMTPQKDGRCAKKSQDMAALTCEAFKAIKEDPSRLSRKAPLIKRLQIAYKAFRFEQQLKVMTALLTELQTPGISKEAFLIKLRIVASCLESVQRKIESNDGDFTTTKYDDYQAIQAALIKQIQALPESLKAQMHDSHIEVSPMTHGSPLSRLSSPLGKSTRRAITPSPASSVPISATTPIERTSAGIGSAQQSTAVLSVFIGDPRTGTYRPEPRHPAATHREIDAITNTASAPTCYSDGTEHDVGV